LEREGWLGSRTTLPASGALGKAGGFETVVTDLLNHRVGS
jgi:hypothetical protein